MWPGRPTCSGLPPNTTTRQRARSDLGPCHTHHSPQQQGEDKDERDGSRTGKVEGKDGQGRRGRTKTRVSVPTGRRKRWRMDTRAADKAGQGNEGGGDKKVENRFSQSSARSEATPSLFRERTPPPSGLGPHSYLSEIKHIHLKVVATLHLTQAALLRAGPSQLCHSRPAGHPARESAAGQPKYRTTAWPVGLRGALATIEFCEHQLVPPALKATTSYFPID